MKKLLILLSPILPLLLAGTLAAQQTIFSEPIGWRGKNIELHTISDRNKQTNGVFLMNSDSIRVFILDSSAVVAQQFHLHRSFVERLLGGFIKDGRLYAFFRVDQGLPRIHGWAFDLSSGKAEDYYIPWKSRHELLINRISCGDHLMFLAVNKKASEFVLYDFKDGQNYDTLHYQFEDGVWKTLTKSAGLSRNLNVAKLDQEGESSVENAGIPNKVYLIHDTLFLLMNGDRGLTGIFSFKAQEKLVSYREIAHNNIAALPSPPSDYTDNSYLLDGKLYFVSASSDSLTVQVRDFGSGQLLQQYAASREEDIPFKNTPIIQEGNSFSKDATRELTKTSQLMRKMHNGTSVIMAGRDDSNRIVLSVGSFAKLSSGGSGGMWMTGGMVGGAVGVALGGMVFMPSGGFYRDTWTKSARFKMLLDGQSLKQIPGEVGPSINEKVEHYTEGTLIPPDGENLFMNNGRYIYGYYNRDEHKLMLVNF